jgi:hypothetical protein
MTKQRRPRRAGPRWGVLFALASAGLLSGCYYYPYGYYPWGYPYPQPYAGGYPYSPGYPYPAQPAPPAAPPTPLNPPPDAPVQRAPLPPAS